MLNYKRPGKDSQVRWTPPSALRKIDLILVDEASQYDDREWHRFFTSVREQPHVPFVAVVADFQQLQPVVMGGLCEKMCKLLMDMACNVILETVYRSKDPDHLLFCNRIRDGQPSRDELSKLFCRTSLQQHLSRRSCLQRHDHPADNRQHLCVALQHECGSRGSEQSGFGNSQCHGGTSK